MNSRFKVVPKLKVKGVEVISEAAVLAGLKGMAVPVGRDGDRR